MTIEPSAPPGRQGRGFTLIELAIVLAAVGLLLATLLPSFKAMAARGQLLAAAQQLQSDIGLAREQASRLAAPVYLSFQPGAQWCYALSSSQELDCRDNAKIDATATATATATTATSPAVIKRVVAADFPGVLLMDAQAMALDHRNGARLGTAGQARFASRTGQQLKVQLGQLGRASLCAPKDSIAGTPICAALTP